MQNILLQPFSMFAWTSKRPSKVYTEIYDICNSYFLQVDALSSTEAKDTVSPQKTATYIFAT